MIWLKGMCQFMDDHVVNTSQWRAHKVAIQHEISFGGETAPALKHLADDKSRSVDSVTDKRLYDAIEPLWKNPSPRNG